jgi:creatinine amidohydrolase
VHRHGHGDRGRLAGRQDQQHAPHAGHLDRLLAAAHGRSRRRPRHHHHPVVDAAGADVRRGAQPIHHGFNKILFINGHGSNVKVVDPVLRKIRYDTGAMVGFCIPYMERYTGLLEGLMENPKDETPGWHASELETSQMLAHNPDIVRMDRAVKTLTNIPKWLPKTFGKKDGAPDIQFEGYSYFQFPMDHHEFTDSGVIGNPERATAEKGQEAFRRYAEHVAKAVQALAAVDVTIKNREFIDRV